MGFRVRPDGMIECDTAQEAIRLRDEMMAHKLKDLRRAKTGPPGRQPTLFGNGSGRLLDILKSNPSGVPSDELAEKLDAPMKSIPPMILALKRRAKKIGLEIEDLIVREKIYKNGKPMSVYRLTEEGLKHLAV